MTAVRAISSPVAALLAVAALCAAAQPAADGLTPHRAVYGLYNNDRRVGESVFSLRYDAATDHYDFETRSEFRGLLRLASPRALVEHSEFTVTDGQIRPLLFAYEDGSRSGRRNVLVRFDWERGRIVAETGAARREWPLPPTGLDRGSARIALMRDLAASVDSGVYQIADPAEVRRYEFHSEGTETVATALGELRAIRIVQQRPGSTRRTVTWAAPGLEFLPVRIEQHREDRDPVAFVLESVEWIDTERATGRP